MKFGATQTRDKDAHLLRGKGVFSGDRDAEGALWLHIVRSDHASGRIQSIDPTEARSMPGVRATLTGADTRAR